MDIRHDVIKDDLYQTILMKHVALGHSALYWFPKKQTGYITKTKKLNLLGPYIISPLLDGLHSL